VAATGLSFGESRGGEYTYGSTRSCIAAGRLTAEFCANAEANAAAEFDEKIFHFPTRTVCEQASAGGCELGFDGAAGWHGKRGAVYFTPRQQGFRVTVRSTQDMTVTPIASGMAFSPRSILRRDIHVLPQIARQTKQPPYGPSGTDLAGFGSSSPDGVRGPIPPPAPIDPAFDCDSYLEPSARGGAEPKCYPTPAARR